MEKITKTDAQWREQLTEEQYRITRESGTERAGTGPFLHNKEPGQYYCVCCGEPLFESGAKYESGCGWPSFYDKMDNDAVGEKEDHSFFMNRTEVHCKKCDAHLGHVFEDGPPPTGLRYCINGNALYFEGNE